MAKLNSIARFLNKTLEIRKIPDSSRNGLQVKSKLTVNKIGFAVDGCMKAFSDAKKKNVDLLIVHHGILWKGQRDKTGLRKEMISFLRKNHINLYAAHLPLDLNSKYGNNAELARILNLYNLKKFGSYKKVAIGFHGTLEKSKTIAEIERILNRKLQTKCWNINFGKKRIKTIGIVSGGGDYSLAEANKLDLDLLITGEASHGTCVVARDLKRNVIVAGHYATETVGVKALMPILAKNFGVKTVFIDNPTNL